MASSSELFDKRIQNFLIGCPTDSYLDIGIGEGKMAQMAKKANPKAQIVGIEPDKKTLFNCKTGIYDKILNISANDLIYRNFRTGTVLMGDVLEHLKKSEGLDFINFILYRCEYLVIKYPPMYLQFGERFDAHVSMWFPKEFEQFNCPILINETDDYMALVVLRGLIGVAKDNSQEIKDLNNIGGL